MELVVGIDMATAAIRAVASDAAGTAHAARSGSFPCRRASTPGGSSRTPGCGGPRPPAAVREVVERLSTGRVVAVSVSGTRSRRAAMLAAAGTIHPDLTAAMRAMARSGP